MVIEPVRFTFSNVHGLLSAPVFGMGLPNSSSCGGPERSMTRTVVSEPAFCAARGAMKHAATATAATMIRPIFNETIVFPPDISRRDVATAVNVSGPSGYALRHRPPERVVVRTPSYSAAQP